MMVSRGLRVWHGDKTSWQHLLTCCVVYCAECCRGADNMWLCGTGISNSQPIRSLLPSSRLRGATRAHRALSLIDWMINIDVISLLYRMMESYKLGWWNCTWIVAALASNNVLLTWNVLMLRLEFHVNNIILEATAATIQVQFHRPLRMPLVSRSECLSCPRSECLSCPQ